MAAFFGASVVAVSAYYMHRKTLNQLLEFAKAIERERDDSAVEEEDGDLVEHLKKYPSRTRRKGRDRRESALSGGGGGQVEDKIRDGTLYVDAVPGGLPRLHVVPEGKPGKVNSTTRVAHLIRPTSPKSPAVSAAAFESIEGSDDEDNMTDNSKLDISYIHTNGNATPSVDEVEVYRNLQECLEMRKSYVFREAITPWKKEITSDPSTPKPNPNPFVHFPEEKSDMEDGVVHVYANKDYLHHLLKVIADGNIRTLCHHRLVLLEQKHLLRFIKSKLRKEPDEGYFKREPDGNDIRRTNVPHIRLEFRDMIWREEMQLVFLGRANFPKFIDP